MVMLVVVGRLFSKGENLQFFDFVQTWYDDTGHSTV